MWWPAQSAEVRAIPLKSRLARFRVGSVPRVINTFPRERKRDTGKQQRVQERERERDRERASEREREMHGTSSGLGLFKQGCLAQLQHGLHASSFLELVQQSRRGRAAGNRRAGAGAGRRTLAGAFSRSLGSLDRIPEERRCLTQGRCLHAPEPYPILKCKMQFPYGAS